MSGHIQLLLALPQAAQIHKLGWDVSGLGGFYIGVCKIAQMGSGKVALGLLIPLCPLGGMIRTSLTA